MPQRQLETRTAIDHIPLDRDGLHFSDVLHAERQRRPPHRGLRRQGGAIDRGRLRRIERPRGTRRKLLQIPIEIRERQVDERDVLANPLDLLEIPDREGVIVAEREEHAVWLDRLYQVVREVARERGVGGLAARRGAEVQSERQHGDQRRDCQQHTRSSAREPRETDPRQHSPHLETHHEEIVPLPHFMLPDGRVLIPEQRKARLEVHVDDETEPGHEPEGAEEVHDAAVAPREIETDHAQPGVQQRYRNDPRDGQRASPLPRPILEVVDELLTDQRDIAAGVPLARQEQRIVEQPARAVLVATDYLQQVGPGLGIGFVEQRLLSRADIQESVDRHADCGDHQRDQGKGKRAHHRARDDRADEERAAHDEQHRASQPDSDQQDPQRAQGRPFRPFRPALVRIGSRRRAQRVPDEQ